MSAKPRRLTFSSLCLAAMALALLWQIAFHLLDTPTVPSPTSVLQRFCHDICHDLKKHVAVSLARLMTGIGIGTALSVPLGLLSGSAPRIDRYLAPVIYLIYPIPKITFLPILLILFGIGDASKVMLITLVTFFQLIVTTRNTALHVDTRWVDAMRSLDCSRWQLLKHVIFPACLPEILNNLRIALGSGIAILFIAETYATQVGIGYFIFDGMARFDYCSVFSGSLALSLLGLGLFLLLDLLQYLLLPWKRNG